jgi:release factor glutamine methyltransferase
MIYSPAEDSYLLEKEVKKFSKNKRVLDIGSGSGIQAVAAINSGAKSVIATDIDKESLVHIRKIVKDNEYNIKIIKSNLFQNIKGKFDLVIFNPPYLPLDDNEDKRSQLITTGGKMGDEITIKFLKQANNRLNNGGTILLLLSSLTPKDKILKLLSKNKMKHKIIASEKLFMEFLEVWKIDKI